MKKVIVFIPLVLMVFISPGQELSKLKIPENTEQITILDSKISLYKAGDFFISGQPSDSMFLALKEKGLNLVINVRTPEEMAALKKEGFNEEALLDSLRIPYKNIPIGGSSGFTKEAIDNIDSAIKENSGNIMIHCRSAGRASNAWVAWLINYKHIPVDQAVTLGKHMQMRFYLEDLLGYELSFGKKE